MNVAVLSGRLTRDPEVKTTQGGTEVCSFTIAVDRRFKDANGERGADFISCVAWRQTADFIGKYFSKGSRIEVSGSIQTRNYEDKDGKKVYVTEINVEQAGFGGDSKTARSETETANTYAAPPEQPTVTVTVSQEMQESFLPGIDSEDLPFTI